MTADHEVAEPTRSPAAHLREQEFRALYDRMRRLVPWGPGDRRGALNYLTANEVLAAAGQVRLGRGVSLACSIGSHVAPDNPEPADHEMTGTAADSGLTGLSFATDRLTMNVHGNADSHIDALCHVMFDQRLYNGVPADSVTQEGAKELSIAAAADGIVGRGVLLDIPPVRNRAWLEPGDHVSVDDLLAAERRQGVSLSRGDLALIRVGHHRRRDERGPWDAAAARAGLHPSVMPLLADRQIAVLGSDGNNDTAPSTVDGVDFPVHVLAINALGIHLLDYLCFEEVVPICQEEARWTFLCVIAPLRLQHGTGSPVNPIGVI